MRLLSLLSLFPTFSAFKYFLNKAQFSSSKSDLHTSKIDIQNDDDSFDPAEFDRVLKSMNPAYTENFKNPNPDIINNLNAESQKNILKEELTRKFPYEDYELPTLPDLNNYYSGTYGDSFW